jgi:phosphonatase-like hydrolase
MSIQLLIFDMAGTTVKDSDNVHMALQSAFKKNHIIISRNEANEVMGYPKPVAIRALLELKGNPQPDESLVEHIFKDFQQEMVSFYRDHPDVAEIKGVSEFFENLHGHGFKIAIDTGFDRTIANAILDRLGWMEKGLIDVSITSDEVANGRPYPDMIYRAMELTGVSSADQVVKVGDTASDLLQGTAAGCKYVVGVTTGAFTKEALLKEPHTHIIDQLSDLMPILNLPNKIITKQQPA